MGDALLTIGQVARQARVNIETLRYYERRRLVQPSSRRESGYRLYTPEAVQKIRFIKNSQELGFTLREISELLRLRVSDRARCGDVKKKAAEKVRDVEGKIRQLQAMKKVLRELVRTCHSRKTTDHCPILRSLEEETP